MPEIREVVLSRKEQTIRIELSDSFNGNRINDNIILHSMIIFSLFDGYIDINYPSCYGKSFRKKYESMPVTDDLEIVQREIYRILKLIRNAIIHSMEAIDHLNNEIKISYIFNSTNFSLKIDEYTLELIYSAVLLILDNRYKNQKYKIGLLRKYFDDITENIIKYNDFSDDIGNMNVATISNEIRLRRIVRYRIINPNYKIDVEHNTVKIEKYKYDYPQYYSAEYLLDYEGSRYIIPDESLDLSGEIKINELINWTK